MITFACPKCSAVHTVPPEQAGAKFRCGCGQKVQAPGTPPPSDVSTMQGVPADPRWPGAANAPGQWTAPAPMPAPAPAPMPAPAAFKAAPPRPAVAVSVSPVAADPSRKQWYYELDGRVVGPIPDPDLKLLAENGTLEPDARVWSEGMADWQPAIGMVPRAFRNVEIGGESGWGVQRVIAAFLATVAVASVVLLGVVYFRHKNKDTTARAEPAKTEQPEQPGGSPTPPGAAPAAAPGGAPVSSVPGTSPAPSPGETLTTQQLFAKCSPAVARVLTGGATGSGFVAGPGLVVTNSHVIDGDLAQSIRVTFPSGPSPKTAVPATLLYEDRARDLAVLRVAGSYPQLALADGIAKGEDVVVIGSPMALGGVAENGVTKGVLSNEVQFRGLRWYQIDASINPGNSGGPVFNTRGQVVGVATMYLKNKQQMNYIIPYGDVAAAVEKAKAGGGPAVLRQHDSGVVVTRLLAAGLIDNALLARYVEAMQKGAASGAGTRAPAVSVQKEWGTKASGMVSSVVSREHRDTARRQAARFGQDAADPRLRPHLESLIRVTDETRALCEFPTRDTFGAFKDKVAATDKELAGLIKPLAAALGMEDDDLIRGALDLAGPAGYFELAPPKK